VRRRALALRPRAPMCTAGRRMTPDMGLTDPVMLTLMVDPVKANDGRT